MIDKNDVGKRFIVSFLQWYAKVFSLKDFYEMEWRSFWSWRIIVSEEKLKKKKDIFDIE